MKVEQKSCKRNAIIPKQLPQDYIIKRVSVTSIKILPLKYRLGRSVMHHTRINEIR